MIEGKNFRGQAFVATVGFIQNLGINASVNKFVDIFKKSSKVQQKALLEGAEENKNLLEAGTDGTPPPIQKQLPTSAITRQGDVIDVDVKIKDFRRSKKSIKILGTDAVEVYKKVEDMANTLQL